jgi:hypothetical protein
MLCHYHNVISSDFPFICYTHLALFIYTRHCQYRNHIHLRTRHYQYRSDPDLIPEDSCRMHLHVYRHRYLDAPDRDWKQKHNCPTN